VVEGDIRELDTEAVFDRGPQHYEPDGITMTKLGLPCCAENDGKELRMRQSDSRDAALADNNGINMNYS
jgi:hypothetical protein